MAVTINGSTSSAYWTFKLVVSEGLPNIANNTSPLTVDVYIGRGASAGSSYMYGASISCPVSVTGCATQTITYKNSGKVTIAAGGWLKIGSVTFPAVPHDADGSKIVTVSASFTNNISPSSGNASGNVTLTTIARASKPALSAAEVTMGNPLIVYTYRASTSFDHALYYTIGNEWVHIASGITDYCSWTVPVSIASSIPNNVKRNVTLILETYSNGKIIGSEQATFTAYVPSSIIPTVSIATSDPTGYKNKYGAFVQGQSKFKIDVSASGVYSSTIKSYKVTADGKTYTTDSVETDAISGSGELTISATVTDSRNRASAVSGKVNVLPYAAPKISSISVYRCNEKGEKTNSGGYLAVKFSAEITALNNKNSAVYSVQYKKSADTNYTTKTLTDYSGQYTIQNGVFIFAADTSSSYDIILTASDDFSGVERLATGSSIKKLWSILKKGFGFAFGKIAELANTLEIALDTIFYNKADFYEGIKIKGYDLDYIVEQGEEDGWFYRKWNSGTAECWKIYYGTDINAAASNYNGFYYSSTIIVPFPFTFANLPTVTVDGGSVANMNFVRTFGKYEDAASFVVVGNTNVTSTDITVDIKAIGKWK